jgi:hypothetical protein
MSHQWLESFILLGNRPHFDMGAFGIEVRSSASGIIRDWMSWPNGKREPIQIPTQQRIKKMSLSMEQAQTIRNELKRFAGDLNLSDEQKSKLHEQLAFVAGTLHEYKKSHPNVTRQDIIKAVAAHRTELREGLERFLNPEQLKKWDAEVAKAREFLGHAAA